MEHRKFKSREGLEADWSPDLTPYVLGIQDACDMVGVEVVAVQGNARSGKTVAAENHSLKRFVHGPHGDMLWYMQSTDDLEDYLEERGEWNLLNHPQIASRLDVGYKRSARDRKRIGSSLARWLAATARTTVGKGAPFIVGDEIDTWQKKIRKAALTRLRNRQREFGSAALLYLASHPDAGPQEGIYSIIELGIRHIWQWLCCHCGKASSPAAEAPPAIRMNWNVPALFQEVKSIELSDALDYVGERARLICPHCKGSIDNEQRLKMSRETGAWCQPGQRLVGPKKVEGKAGVNKIMGFVIHAFMAPFIELGEAAREWVAGMREFNNTQDDTMIREATTKTLGEVFKGASADTKIEDWKVIKKRMQSGDPYLKRTVPDGVDFLVAFVDIQKRGFEVRVIGYSALDMESWLIDAFLVDQHLEDGPQHGNRLDPFNRVSDWSVLEEAVLDLSYPLASAPEYHLPIARMGIDTGGGDETTANARVWAAGVIHRERNPIADWRIMLTKGNAHKTGELYGVPRQVLKDDHGKGIDGRKIDLPPMMGPVWERTIQVYGLKKIIRRRQNIAVPGPGFMNAPQNIEDQYVRELVSETFLNDEWIKSGDNETWDAYVAGEVLRASLYPEKVNWDRPPVWARPFRPAVERGIDRKPAGRVSPYARVLRMNMRGGGRDGTVQRP